MWSPPIHSEAAKFSLWVRGAWYRSGHREREFKNSHSFIDHSYIWLNYLKYVERGKPDFFGESKVFTFPPVFSTPWTLPHGAAAPPPPPATL
jgi:hypothetical protein